MFYDICSLAFQHTWLIACFWSDVIIADLQGILRSAATLLLGFYSDMNFENADIGYKGLLC